VCPQPTWHITEKHVKWFETMISIQKNSLEKHNMALTSENDAGEDFGVDELPTSVVSTVSSTIGNLLATLNLSLISLMLDESSAVKSCPCLTRWRLWRVICSRHRFVCAFIRSRAHILLPLVLRVSGPDRQPAEAEQVLEYTLRVGSVVFALEEKPCNLDKRLFWRRPDVQIKTYTLIRTTVLLL